MSMSCNLFLAGLTLILYCFTQYAVADFPNFISGFGLTVTNFSKVNDELYDVIVQSNEVKDDQKVRILLPFNYTTSGPTRHYPVLYLLHGAHGNAERWTVGGGMAQQILGALPLITVMPNGDPFGWYTNWVNPGEAAPQNWKNFHMDQLVPWIDLNLRTVAKKGGRAIAGYSMGGYGAIHYAELYPQYFNYSASFSGVLDLTNVGIQIFIATTEGIDKNKISGPFGPPFILTNGSGWIQENTRTHGQTLRDTNIALYTGDRGVPEIDMYLCNIDMHKALKELNISHIFIDYGDGKSIGHGCDGKHDYACWNAALIDCAPRIMAVLEQEL